MSSFFALATTALFCQSKRGATLKESGLEHQMCTRYIHQMKKPTPAHANKECQEGGRLTKNSIQNLNSMFAFKFLSEKLVDRGTDRHGS